ncbi:hypothetical protein V6N13_113580 [Hibiscus sabdariffa]|uniref:MLO-like protein n=1 Tax=Hibiscus sabdariffa TaxID=183260 RepID=A0ABR2TZ89_9ROSI
MAGSGGGRSLEETPTWAVAVVCFVLVLISIIIEHILHMIGNWLRKKHKRALYEALEKIKSEEIAATWHPCSKKQDEKLFNGSDDTDTENRRRLLAISDPGGVSRRSLAGGSVNKCAAQGKVPFVSSDGIHQLHMFIFVLALFHVLYCVLTLALGRAKMRSWEKWEKETRTIEYQFSHDPERFRFTRETSFGRRHLNYWTKTPVFIWIVCFFRQFVRSVPKVDYLTLRHGFIVAHLAPNSQTKFDFQKYINRSLDEDFNIILLVGTKLQVIITKMGLRIQDRGEVVKGVPVVQPGDDLFWLNRPRLLLYLINFVLFQNAFQLAFFAWTWSQFGIRSCFHEHVEDVIVRISMGVIVQILCSYVTLPLYALVTQMSSNMKLTIFNERVATALKNWHNTAKKHIKHNKGLVTPFSSRPTTPSHHASPVHLLRSRQNEIDSLNISPRRMNFEIESDIETPSPSQNNCVDGSSTSHYHINVVEQDQVEYVDKDLCESNLSEQGEATHHKINSKEFSFDRRTN